ncbi:Vacuolar protein sorting-associated protein 9A [Zea mays]|uniref:Vacuolar protein sorting-associated protein 9A n=1 Tax=Zea mays TaxID=4577 RepID=A0A1D6EE76_MAIZE|nr:Vacuolar protein sorting-associated protein 9A [Zea mays]
MDKKEDGPGSQCGHTLTAVPLSAGSFLVSFSFHTANAEEDDSKVQAFLAEMESSIRDPSLRANATDQEIDHALEGLEKYVMTKLFDRTFGTSTEDAISDMDISEKIGLLQQFVKPHHSDIPKVLHNEPSWLVTHSELEASTMRFQSLMLAISSKDGMIQPKLMLTMTILSLHMPLQLAVKELQNINSFKAPREKLLCIMSCYQVINNLLLNISMSNDRTLSGVDEFLPILICYYQGKQLLVLATVYSFYFFLLVRCN